MKSSKIRKVVAVLTLVSAVVVGSQSAFANTNINEQNDIQNNGYYTPEAFLAGAPSGANNPFLYNKVGTLSSSTDMDWYTISFPSNTYFPGAKALITMAFPSGYYGYVGLTTETGGYVQRTIVNDSPGIFQFEFEFQPNTIYRLRVDSNGPNPGPFTYILGVD
ncbi:hypothetical protein [Cohnella cholangitidis]|uniref:Uncharacterized protein n=1 Tax=Cohnella cholangitidis TaxID=2598458 RepID=A0A7G5BTE4_9BACL|nr:hypothetical protein [Cohnella cholangitidis]QMV40228.1 hypothetical protein FPL14_02695 [Cohnella cholangitidis]